MLKAVQLLDLRTTHWFYVEEKDGCSLSRMIGSP